MGRRGPPRKPDEQKAREGNPSDHALNTRMPEYDEAEIVAPPEDLKAPGRALWIKQSGMMIQHGVLRRTDIEILHKYCKVYDDLAFYEKLKDALTAKRKLGYFELKELHATQRGIIQLRTQFKHFAQELGLTPSSRSIVTGKGKGRRRSAGKEEKGSGQTGGNTARFFGGGNIRAVPPRTGTDDGKK
jgi:P27 family predicted phage terminase small subunit